eukprot:2204924-Pyramimonas_sp.AAC.1
MRIDKLEGRGVGEERQAEGAALENNTFNQPREAGEGRVVGEQDSTASRARIAKSAGNLKSPRQLSGVEIAACEAESIPQEVPIDQRPQGSLTIPARGARLGSDGGGGRGTGKRAEKEDCQAKIC